MPTEPTDITSLLHERAAAHGDRPALCFMPTGGEVQETLSFRELAEQTQVLAGALAANFAPGTRVLLMQPSSLDFIRAFFACCAAQLIAVPVFPAPTRRPRFVDRLQGIARDARPGLMLCAPAARAATEEFCRDLALACRVACVEDFASQPSAALPPRRSQVAFLQYTSGSTSAPKGVVVAHANLLANMRGTAERLGWTSDDRMLSWLPLFHDMGLICGVLYPLYCGMTGYLMPTEAFVRAPRRWLEAISRVRATATAGNDFAYALCARTLDDAVVRQLDLRCLKAAISGGEPVQPETQRMFARAFAPAGFDAAALAPSYGQAEATLCVSAPAPGPRVATVLLDRVAASEGRVQLLDGASARGSAALELVGCGQLLSEYEAAIVDPVSLRRCEPDRIGELWLRGSSVACGYFENTAASEDTFAARIAGEEHSAWLRTGDLVFFHRAELVPCGRLKDTIIVAGRNLYPHDLEQAAARAAGLRSGRCVAVAQYDAALGREVLWLIAEPETRRLSAAATLQLLAAIQEAALEACDVAFDRIVLVRAGSVPFTTSGKLSRQSTKAMLEAGQLPILADTSQQLSAASVAPRAPTPEACLSSFARLLAQLRPGAPLRPQHTLLDHGCDSLALVALRSALAELGYEPELAALFGGKTLAELASDWAALLSTQPPPKAAEPDVLRTHERFPEAGPHPLSHAQQRLWFLYELAPERCDQNLVVRLRLRGALDRSALQAALDWAVQRHAVLRTRYLTSPEGPQAFADAAAALPLAFVDLEPEGTAAEVTIRNAVDEQRRTPFALRHTGAPQPPAALRAQLFRRGDELHELLLALHHIAFDGRSAEILLRDLERCYRAAQRGAPLPQASGPQYSDFARAERSGWDAAAEARALACFREQLADLPELQLPRVTGASGGDGVVRFAMSRADAEQVARVAQAQRATPFVVLVSAFAMVVRHLTGCDRFALGTDVAARHGALAGGLLGFFVNQLALRCDVSGAVSLRALIARQLADALQAYAHEQLPFDRVVSACGLAGAPFQIKLNHQPRFFTRQQLADLAIELEVQQARGEFPLVLDLVAAADGGMDAVLEYDLALSPRFVKRLERLWSRLIAELEGLLEHPLPALLEQLSAWDAELDAHEASTARARLGDSRRRAIAAPRTTAEET